MQNEIEENTTVAPWTDERFLRSRIVLGSEGLERLWGAHVVVVGYGAVGSAAAEALVRSGLGHIRIIDADVYDVTNTNRQLGCECSTIGKPKVEVGLAHFKALSPQIDAEAIVSFVGAATMDLVLRPFADGSAPTLVVDAIDTLDAKVALLQAAYEAGLAVYSSMGAARKTHPEAIRFGDISKTEVCPLAREVRKRLKKIGISKGISCVYSIETVDSSTHRANPLSRGGCQAPAIGQSHDGDCVVWTTASRRSHRQIDLQSCRINTTRREANAMQRGNEHHPRLSHLLSPLKHHGVEYRGLRRVAPPHRRGELGRPNHSNSPTPQRGDLGRGETNIIQ